VVESDGVIPFPNVVETGGVWGEADGGMIFVKVWWTDEVDSLERDDSDLKKLMGAKID
jgi:hypothetical protein